MLNPNAIEALDGDSWAWVVRMYAVTRKPRAEVLLAGIPHGSDPRLFNSIVPRWPESAEAVETGSALAQHFGLPLFFLVNPSAVRSPVFDFSTARWRARPRDASA